MPLQDDPRLAVPAHALAGLLGSLPARPAPVEALPEAMLAARALVWDAFEAGQTTVFEAIDALDHASALTDDGRKNGGVVYTPPALARSMCKILAPKLTDRLLEPSCGRGVFVFSVLEEQRERFNLSWEEAARWSEKHLFASELDAQALADLGWLWRVHFHAQGSKATWPRMAICGLETLFSAAFPKSALTRSWATRLMCASRTWLTSSG